MLRPTEVMAKLKISASEEELLSSQSTCRKKITNANPEGQYKNGSRFFNEVRIALDHLEKLICKR